MLQIDLRDFIPTQVGRLVFFIMNAANPKSLRKSVFLSFVKVYVVLGVFQFNRKKYRIA